MTEYLGPYQLGYNETEECGIYHGDARLLALDIPDESVDLVFISRAKNVASELLY